MRARREWESVGRAAAGAAAEAGAGAGGLTQHAPGRDAAELQPQCGGVPPAHPPPTHLGPSLGGGLDKCRGKGSTANLACHRRAACDGTVATVGVGVEGARGGVACTPHLLQTARQARVHSTRSTHGRKGNAPAVTWFRAQAADWAMVEAEALALLHALEQARSKPFLLASLLVCRRDKGKGGLGSKGGREQGPVWLGRLQELAACLPAVL